MTFATGRHYELSRHATGLEQSLSGIIKQLELDIHVQVETISSPMILTADHITDFIFLAKTSLNEAQNFEEAGLPFRIRLKALLQILVVGLPCAFTSCRWSIPSIDLKNDGGSLTVKGIEATFIENMPFSNDTPSRWEYGARFRIRATETMKLALSRK